MSKRQQIQDRVLEETRKLVGAPFRHQGRGSAGFDCIGAFVCGARNAGCSIRDFPNYPRTGNLRLLLRHLEEQLVEIPIASLDRADIIVCRMLHSTAHAAMRSDYGIIFASMDPAPGFKSGRVVETTFGEPWKSARLVSAHRLREIHEAV